MGILIPRQLTQQQYIKVFSNPVSGIACEVSAYMRDHGVKHNIQNIRYSKSMILNALKFWSDQLFNYYLKITKITNPLAPQHDSGQHTLMDINTLNETIELVKKFPDTFLFSHRYIQRINPNNYTQGMKIQSKLLEDKYPISIQFQKGSGDPHYPMTTFPNFIFTIFPNEHPYIIKQKITKVGMTDRGNVYVMLSK
jgi:hypothetical protein